MVGISLWLTPSGLSLPLCLIPFADATVAWTYSVDWVLEGASHWSHLGSLAHHWRALVAATLITIVEALALVHMPPCLAVVMCASMSCELFCVSRTLAPCACVHVGVRVTPLSTGCDGGNRVAMCSTDRTTVCACGNG